MKRSGGFGATVLLHALVVFALTGSVAIPLGFFLASFGLGRLASAPGRGRRLRVALGLSLLTALLLAFRGARPVLGVLGSLGLPAALLGGAARIDFTFTGLAYCYLRAAYALLDPRPSSFTGFARYFFFAPTFVSGPVMTPEQLRGQAEAVTARSLGLGAAGISAGLVRVAAAAILMRAVPLGSPDALRGALDAWTTPALWVGVAASGLWLYLDFSGWSAIFIGAARSIGIRVPENFAGPYGATSITAFWQRWHVSLGDWLRAVVYTPLSRTFVSRGRTALGAAVVPVVTMLACGAWHRASATFLCWGLLHGIGLALHAVWRATARKRIPGRVQSHWSYGAASWVLTHAYVTFAWVFFLPTDAVDLGTRLELARALLGAR